MLTRLVTRTWPVILVMVFVAVVAACEGDVAPSPSGTAGIETDAATPTATVAAIPTQSPRPTPAPTPVPTPAPTATPTPAPTAAPSPTATVAVAAPEAGDGPPGILWSIPFILVFGVILGIFFYLRTRR